MGMFAPKNIFPCTNCASESANFTAGQLYVKSYTLTPEEILSCSSYPVTVIPSYGDNTGIAVVNTLVKLAAGSTAYVTVANFVLKSEGALYQQQVLPYGCFTPSIDTMTVNPASTSNQANFVENAPIKFTSTANPALGDGIVTLFITYTVYNL